MTAVSNVFDGYEFIIAMDVSNSMNSPMEGGEEGTSRLDFVRDFVADLATQVMEYDDNGLDVVCFGHKVKHFDEVDSPKRVAELIDEVRQDKTFGHGTDTVAAVKMCHDIHEGHVKSLGEKHNCTVILVLTDGKPSNPDGAVQAELLRVAKSVGDNQKIAFSFLQVGKEKKAAKFLKKLDDFAPEKWDITDTKRFADLMLDGKISLAQVVHAAITD
jgi:Mg-chelatase subunit ChlD